MHLNTDSLPWPIASQLQHLLQDVTTNIQTGTGVIVTYSDPNYAPNTGGYHPVEFAIDRNGKLLYVTDFTFTGRPPDIELVKEIDFDFSCGVFGHLGIDYPIKKGLELFCIWQSNFLAYHEMGVYTVSLESMS